MEELLMARQPVAFMQIPMSRSGLYMNFLKNIEIVDQELRYYLTVAYGRKSEETMMSELP